MIKTRRWMDGSLGCGRSSVCSVTISAASESEGFQSSFHRPRIAGMQYGQLPFGQIEIEPEDAVYLLQFHPYQVFFAGTIHLRDGKHGFINVVFH